MSFPWPDADLFNNWFSWVNMDAIDMAKLECIQVCPGPIAFFLAVHQPLSSPFAGPC